MLYEMVEKGLQADSEEIRFRSLTLLRSDLLQMEEEIVPAFFWLPAEST